VALIIITLIQKPEWDESWEHSEDLPSSLISAIKSGVYGRIDLGAEQLDW